MMGQLSPALGGVLSLLLLRLTLASGLALDRGVALCEVSLLSHPLANLLGKTSSIYILLPQTEADTPQKGAFHRVQGPWHLPFVQVEEALRGPSGGHLLSWQLRPLGPEGMAGRGPADPGRLTVPPRHRLPALGA